MKEYISAQLSGGLRGTFKYLAVSFHEIDKLLINYQSVRELGESPNEMNVLGSGEVDFDFLFGGPISEGVECELKTLGGEVFSKS